jgi:hypothetical protein
MKNQEDIDLINYRYKLIIFYMWDVEKALGIESESILLTIDKI